MISYKKKLRIRLIIFGMIALFLATGLLGFAFREGIEFYKVPTQILNDMPLPSTRLRMGGLVERNSVVRLDGIKLSFKVTDTVNSIRVHYEGIVPDLFSEGEGVVVAGTFNGEFFEAVEVLAKHDETYMPKEVIKLLEKEGITLNDYR